MATFLLRGTAIPTSGDLPRVGAPAPDATLTPADFNDRAVSSYAGWRVCNIFLSVDTGVCAASIRTFAARCADRPGVTVLHIAHDLPFAMKRFCGAEGLPNQVVLSTFRSKLPDAWGLRMAGGPFSGCCARAVVVLDPDGVTRHTELVAEVGQEPNYDAALAVLPA